MLDPKEGDGKGEEDQHEARSGEGILLVQLRPVVLVIKIYRWVVFKLGNFLLHL